MLIDDGSAESYYKAIAMANKWAGILEAYGQNTSLGVVEIEGKTYNVVDLLSKATGEAMQTLRLDNRGVRRATNQDQS